MRLVLPALILALALAAPARADEPPRQIVVNGSAEVDAKPDLATVTAGVETQAATAAEALAANSTAMTAVLDALAAAGVADADVQTSQLDVSALWEDPGQGGGQPRVSGYQASNLVTIRVRDIAKLGALIDAVTAAGANRMFGIGFEVADPRPHLDAARERAVADARARAELYARAAGVTLGPVLSIREPVTGGPQPMFARAEAAMDVPVAEGSVRITAQVEIVYRID